ARVQYSNGAPVRTYPGGAEYHGILNERKPRFVDSSPPPPAGGQQHFRRWLDRPFESCLRGFVGSQFHCYRPIGGRHVNDGQHWTLSVKKAGTWRSPKNGAQ